MIEIRLPGTVKLPRTAVEVRAAIMAERPDIGQTALKRGKAMTRARQRD